MPTGQKAQIKSAHFQCQPKPMGSFLAAFHAEKGDGSIVTVTAAVTSRASLGGPVSKAVANYVKTRPGWRSDGTETKHSKKPSLRPGNERVRPGSGGGPILVDAASP